MDDPAAGKRVALAAVAGAHGIKGEVRLKLFADSAESLARHPRLFVAGVERQGRVLGSGSPGMRVSTIYRNQFWVLEQGGRQLLGIGIHGQLLYLDSDNDTVVVKLSSWPTPQDPWKLFSTVAAFDAISAEVAQV